MSILWDKMLRDRVNEIKKTYRDMKDLGYMNGWGNIIPKEMAEALKKGYEIKERKIGRCLHEYTCEKGGFYYKIDSSD